MAEWIRRRASDQAFETLGLNIFGQITDLLAGSLNLLYNCSSHKPYTHEDGQSKKRWLPLKKVITTILREILPCCRQTFGLFLIQI